MFESCTEVARQRSPEWFAARKSGIGASECATACGTSEYRTALALYREKVGLDEPAEQSEYMRNGLYFENTILRIFRHETGVTLRPRRPPMLRSIQFPWMFCSPDGVTKDGDLVDAKMTTWRMADKWGEPGSDEVPKDILYQMHHQLVVTGRDRVWIPRLVDGQKFACFKVERNERLNSLIIDSEREFWRRVEQEDPPEPDWTHSTTPSLIRGMFGITSGKAHQFSPDAIEWQTEYERWSKVEAGAAAMCDILRARQLKEMGEAEIGLLGDGYCIRRQEQTIKEHTVAEFKKIDVRKVKVPK